jgi:hypothetical protein
VPQQNAPTREAMLEYLVFIMKTTHNFTKVQLLFYIYTARYAAGDIRQVEILLVKKPQFSISAVS